MFFPHQRHNELVRLAREVLPYSFSEINSPARLHPWQLRPLWKKDTTVLGGGYWMGVITPGLVNGLPAQVNTTYGMASPAARARIEKERREKGKELPAPEDPVRAFLDEDQPIRLQWKSAGLQPNRRFLYTGEIILSQFRTGLVGRVLFSAAPGGTRITVQPDLVLAATKDPVVSSVPEYVEPTPASKRDMMFGRFLDDGMDVLPLARVYAESAPMDARDAPPSMNLDVSFRITARYFVHYNLAYATRNPDRPRETTPVNFLYTGLVGGMFDGLFNQLLGDSGTYLDDALNLLRDTTPKGLFYEV